MIESVYQAKVGSLMNQIRAYQDRTDLINSDVGTQRVDQTNRSGFADYRRGDGRVARRVSALFQCV